MELPKTVTITPSENTHFRVILSSEAMETDERERALGSPGCTIVKPEPRTPVIPKTPTELELETVPSGMLTSTPSSILPAAPTAPVAASAAHIGADMGDVGPKTDSPSKKKGGPVKHHSLSYFQGHSAHKLIFTCDCYLYLIVEVDKGVADSCLTSLIQCVLEIKIVYLNQSNVVLSS